MRLPEIDENGTYRIDEEKALAVIIRAFELGVNYIDTAYGYCHGNSEIVVGKALKGWRDKVYLSTKMPTWLVKERGDYRRFLEEQLQKLDVDYIDLYHFHALGQERWESFVLTHDCDLVTGCRRTLGGSFENHPAAFGRTKRKYTGIGPALCVG